MSYKLTNGNTILRIADNSFIPIDPANVDYMSYLAWLEEGNEPEPAPEPPTPPKLTTEEKLAAAGFEISELRKLLLGK